MLKLRDFLHLPQLDPLISRLVNGGPGVIVLAGIDARPVTHGPGESVVPSGLSAMFNILMQEIMLAHPLSNAIVVAEERTLARAPRTLKRRVGFFRVEPPSSYAEQIELASRQIPGLLVIDRLDKANAAAAFQAAKRGVRVLTQLDTVLRGSSVARQMLELDVPHEQVRHLRWVLTMQRMSVLCTHCRQPAVLDDAIVERLCGRYPGLKPVIAQLSQPAPTRAKGRENTSPRFYRAGGCDHCRQTGFLGDMSVFDLFYGDPDGADMFTQPSLLPLEEYALHLASMGQIDLDDLIDLENDHLRRTYHMLTASERALTEANDQLNSKLMELEATNRVLVQRTEVLISLQELGQALISSTELDRLAESVCRRASEMCKADRVVLYLRRVSEKGEETAVVLAVRGWNKDGIGRQVPPAQVFDGMVKGKAARYMHAPPGVRPLPEKASGESPANLGLMGLRVPLLAQDQLVGVMIMQSTRRDSFHPGEVALVQTFANQAALAIQRADLVDDLRGKIEQLEAAQAELVKKERMERELELARQVQQSMLPHSFPEVPGFVVSANNEPARQVGGDFYDVIVLDQDHFGLVIADVADKGLPAALYMALTRSLLLAEARREQSPRQALLNVNRLLLELGELNGFVSVFYGVVECSTRRFTYARAGHERPLLLRGSDVQQIGGSGTVLGILDSDSLNLAEDQILLVPGDRLVLYTDGLTDTTDAQGQFFGLERLIDLLKPLSDYMPEPMCQKIFDHLADHRGVSDPFDDMTVLVMSVQN
jgi:phosphoserine phosphatase RsbU/P